MINLRKFEQHSQYEAFTATTEFILPNVSICVQEGDVHYNPEEGPTPPTPTPIYQWVVVSGGYECSGTTKMTQEKEQVSYDNGTTWEDVSPLTTRAALPVIEYNSVDCGYVPPTYGPYLTFVAEESGNFSFTNAVDYSMNSGATWQTLAANTPLSVNSGDKVMWKETLTPSGSDGIGTFSSTGRFSAGGNPMSLLYGDNFDGQTSLVGKDNAFTRLFSGCTTLTSINGLELPATTLGESCYNSMFTDCTSLTTVPSGLLPATTLTFACYESMFKACSSLTTVPSGFLQATTLANYCYANMFFECTSLTTVPSDLLPATTLATSCYQTIFYGCTSLAAAPDLLTTTLADYCYDNMFNGCISLNYIKCLATNITAFQCTYYWVKNVASSGTFVKDASMMTWPGGDSGIPSGWNVQNT